MSLQPNKRSKLSQSSPACSCISSSFVRSRMATARRRKASGSTPAFTPGSGSRPRSPPTSSTGSALRRKYMADYYLLGAEKCSHETCRSLRLCLIEYDWCIIILFDPRHTPPHAFSAALAVSRPGRRRSGCTRSGLCYDMLSRLPSVN